VRWQLSTSYGTGTKTITASDGTEFTFPFSVQTDGTAIVPNSKTAVAQVVTEVDTAESTDPPQTKAANASPRHDDEPDTKSSGLGAPPDGNVTLSHCAAAAGHAIVSGVAGAFGSAWLESTPSVPLAGSSEEMDRLQALANELLKAADGIFTGTDNEPAVKTPKAAAKPLSNAKKKKQSGHTKWLLQGKLSKAAKPRNHARGAAAGAAAYALLASLIWAATVSVAVAGGVVPHSPFTWDHAAPQREPDEVYETNPGVEEVPEPPPEDPNDPVVRKVKWQCSAAANPYSTWYSGPSGPATASEVGAWADWQREKPDDFLGRATKLFMLKEVTAAVHRVEAHPMFNTTVHGYHHGPTGKAAVVRKVALPPDVAALVWEELKLDNNPKLCNDDKLRENALAMIGDMVGAFHKPDPLLRPILNKDGTPLKVHVHTYDGREPSLFAHVPCLSRPAAGDEGQAQRNDGTGSDSEEPQFVVLSPGLRA
jgi:hypothetical protein